MSDGGLNVNADPDSIETAISISGNQRYSLQLFAVEFDTCLVWELLLLPSNAQTAPNSPFLKGA